jgi:RecB family exonuclease
MPEADDECFPFVKAWATLRETLKFEIVDSELMVFHDALRYAGTLDRIVRMQDRELAVLDIKSGAKAKWHPLQLAAYALAYEEITEIPIDLGIAVYLKETGKASVEKYAEYDMRKYKEQWTNIMIRRNEL